MTIDPVQIIHLVHQTKPLIMNPKKAQAITVKGPADFVTAIDTCVQEFLKSKLEELFPDVQFMGEENHMNTIDPDRPAWILDPIDGTTNLIYDFRHSAVSLGYYEDHRIVFGIVYNPFTDETFHAILGQGAYLNEQPIHVSAKKKLSDSLVAIGTSPYDKQWADENFALFKKIFENCLDIRRTGAASLDLAYVACGRQDAYIERNLKPWDFAAGSIILTEAGGQISQYNAEPVNYCSNQDILATNTYIHNELQTFL